MRKLRSAFLVILILMIALTTALADKSVDLEMLESSLRAGSSSPKDVQTMLKNAWLNGYDHCKVSASKNSDSFVIEIAVGGLASPLKVLARSEDAQDAETFMAVRETLLSHCQSVIALLEASGVSNLHFSFVLLDDTKVLSHEYAVAAVMATITVSNGQPVRVESIWEAWNVPVLDVVSADSLENDPGEETIVKREPTYILNVKSKKFHFPTCESVSMTKEQNRKEFFGTRDAVLSIGYSPCGSCHP